MIEEQKLKQMWFDWLSIILLCFQTFLGFRFALAADSHGILNAGFILISLAFIIILFIKAVFKKKYRLYFWIYLLILIVNLIGFEVSRNCIGAFPKEAKNSNFKLL